MYALPSSNPVRINIDNGEELKMRKHIREFLKVENFREMEWFRPPGISGDEDSYGGSEGTYSVDRQLNLLNLGNADARQMVLNHTDVTKEDLNPDMQYSCHKSNWKVHEAILDSNFFSLYDGTYISALEIDDELKDDLEGPEEIVLFTDRVKRAISLIKVET